MDNRCYFKSTGRYRTIPLCVELYDSLAKTIPVQLKRATAKSNWSSVSKKQKVFNEQYPALSEGDLFVSRTQNQLVTYMPYTYLNSKRTGATAEPSYTMKKGLLATGSATAQWDAETSTYTLTVKHKGGVDITVNCSGNQTPLPWGGVGGGLPLPQQPSAFHGPIIVEAENMDYKNVKEIKLVNPYVNYFPDIVEFAGNGLVDMGTSTSGTLRHQLTLKEGEEGDYLIAVRYCNTTKTGKMKATVNGKATQLDIEKAAKNDWRKATFTASLKAGKNNLLIQNTGGIAMYIDQIIYTPADVEAEKYQIFVRKANYGSLTPRVSEAAEGDTVVIDITANEGYGLKELRVINGVNFTMGTNISLETLSNGNSRLTFTMPDDIVTLQPVFARGENVVDGIGIVQADGTRATVLYDLNGRRVSAPSKSGIYIKNGKKVVMK